MNKFILLYIIIMIIPFVMANGLKVTPASFTINKTYGIDKQITIYISNEEPFSFYNVSFEENDVITISNINEIKSGENKTTTATITYNKDFSDIIRLKGYFESQIGIQNKTYNIDVEYNEGLSVCDLTIIKQDRVIWRNLVSNEIKMKNMDTGEYVTTIPENSNYTMNFNIPETFTYAFYRGGFMFTDVCTITVLDDVGYVNDPDLDGAIALDLSISFESTTIEVNVLENNYTLDFFESDEGILTIKNTGNKKAFGIKLEGDWFSFNKNNFDLDSGKTTVITYTILQNKQGVVSTNNTNKEYTKNISIYGNFETITKKFSIFINYADIDNSSYSGKGLFDLIEKFCNENPNVCYKEKIVYRDGSSDRIVSTNYTEEQIKSMHDANFDLIDIVRELLQYEKDKSVNDSETDTLTSSRLTNIENLILEQTTNEDEGRINIWFGIALFTMIIITIMLIFNILLFKRNKELKKYTM